MNQELPAGSTLSHYRVVSKIGAGGMGEVYLAQDTKLDRKVALKILPADVASNRDNHVTAQNWICHTYNAKGMYAESLAIAEKREQSGSPLSP